MLRRNVVRSPRRASALDVHGFTTFYGNRQRRGRRIQPRAGNKVLILASDPLLAALLGGLVELARLEAAFARDGELPADALARVRPLAAILIEAVLEDAESDLFLTRARKRGVEVLVFGSAVAIDRIASWARMQNVPTFVLPADVTQLQGALDRLRNPAPEAPRKGGRRAPELQRGADGSLVFEDAKGTRWSVYDRRTDGDRRGVDRQFVSEKGEVRHCGVTLKEAESLSVASLSEQLARSVTE